MSDLDERQSKPSFRDWLRTVLPRFPEFEELAQVIEASGDWPTGYDKEACSSFLSQKKRCDLIRSMGRAIDAFDLLCMPTAPIPDELRGLPWDWHSSSLVQRSMASAKRHDRSPNVSTQEYRWQLGKKLARQIGRMTPILIDTCHWLKMRDHELKRPVAAEYGEILHHLRWLVSSQRYVCPITPALFLELQTQTDRNTRMRTARLMEELSSNVVLPDLAVMEKLEVRRRAFDQFFGTGALNTDWQVWTRPGFLLGEQWPVPAENWMSEKEIWRLQKSCIDSMWEAPLTQVIGVLDAPQSTKDLRDDFERIMNEDRTARPPGDFEFERQRAEIMVLREIVIPAVKELTPELERVARRRPSFQFPDAKAASERDPWCIPSVQIIAGIEALIRTTNRRFRGNDMFDLYHCGAALPYCDVFFCDRAFERILKDPKLRYHEVYSIEVMSSPSRILRYLQGLC